MAPGEQPDLAALERMAIALAHRGPDDRGIEIRGSVGLVHTRLAIVDPSSAGRQPMVDPSGRFVLTYNGEIYNHIALRRSLEGPYRGHSDTETLLKALATWGEDALPRCNGIFAFAALDSQRGRLLLARDHLGIKPLYVGTHKGTVWFASEMRALLAAGVPRRPRREVLATYLGGTWVHGRETAIENVDCLLPGTIVEVDLETLDRRERTWWAPGDGVDPELGATLARLDHEELTERFVAKLRDAVHRQLMADVPVGVMCSGGLDSSVVAALARERGARVVAYNAAMVEDRADESPQAELVSRALGLEFRTVEMTLHRWRQDFVSAVNYFEYPITNVAAVPIAAIAELARGDGVKVLLTGEGADELFGGYAFNHWRRAAAFLSMPARIRLGLEHLRSDRYLMSQRLRLRRRASPTANLLRMDTTNEHRRYQEYIQSTASNAYRHQPEARRNLEASLLGDLYLGLRTLLNRDDKNAMARSVEARVPYLDFEMMPFVLNLPVESRIGPRPKRILRDAAARLLPKAIARRPKQLSMTAGARRYVERAARREFVEHGCLREVFEVPLPAWRDALDREIGERRFAVWTAEIWSRLFLGGEDVTAVESKLWAASA